MGRRGPEKTDAQKKEEKRLYDIEYRKRNLEEIKRKKKERYYANHERELEKQRERRNRPGAYEKHLTYLRTEKYKDYRKYRAKAFGEYAEAHEALLELEQELHRLFPDKNRLYWLKGTANKRQRRLRETQRQNRFTHRA